MSDLIRREDALSKFEKACTCDSVDKNGMKRGEIKTALTWEGIRKILENIPSAEPELDKHEWCDDCKEYDQEKHCCPRWNKVIGKTVEDMKKNQWIHTTEALPEDMDRILATIVRSNGEKRVRSGDYFKGYFMMDNGDTWNETDKEVIAWMPLIEPYRGDR